MDAIVKVMVEVLCILAIATKEIKQNRASELMIGDRFGLLAYSSPEKLLKKLVGKTDIEDALQRLEKVTVEEARMAGAEALKAIHGVGNQVGDKVDGVQDTLKVVEDKMRGVEDMLQGVGEILQGVDDKVKEIGNKAITGAQNTSNQLSPPLQLFLPLGVEKPVRQMADDFDKTAHGVDDKIKSVDDTVQSADDTQQDIKAKVSDGAQVTPNQILYHPECFIYSDAEKISRPMARDFGDLTRSSPRSRPSLAVAAQTLTEDKSRRDCVEWLSPPDPSINYNIARDTHHKGTALWFTESSAFRDWKTSGSLLWIHGKRTSLSPSHLRSL